MTDADAVIRKIQLSRIAIYGAGAVATKFYKALLYRGISNVDCVIVTEKGEQDKFFDIPIVEANPNLINKDLLICIATHEAVKEEIEHHLQRIGLDNYVWIYPYMMRLFCGKQISYATELDVYDILKKNNDYRIAVRYLAIENYYGKNNCGFDIYRKSFEVACGETGAIKRVENFKNLIESYKKYGYIDSNVISVDESSFLLDGAHRVALALYYKIDNLRADIYPKVKHYFEWDDEKEFLTEHVFELMDFSNAEMALIKETDTMLRRGKEIR